MHDATDANNHAFIPPEKRYVVFDNDGTLWPEAPITFQIQFVLMKSSVLPLNILNGKTIRWSARC